MNGTAIAKNLLYGKAWSLSNVTYADGIFTFAPNVLAMAQCSMDTPVANHIYYGGCWQKSPSGSSFPDRRFEWFKSDNAGENMVFATMEDTNGEWRLFTNRIQAPSSPTATWTWRNFTVSGTAECYRKGLILIDLTETFGSGNEPSKEWLDENLRHISDEFVTFSNIRCNIVGRRRILQSALGSKRFYVFKEGEGMLLGTHSEGNKYTTVNASTISIGSRHFSNKDTSCGMILGLTVSGGSTGWYDAGGGYDFTPYKKLCIEAKSRTNGYECRIGYRSDERFSAGALYLEKNEDSDNFSGGTYIRFSSNVRTVYELDISSRSGKYYIQLMAPFTSMYNVYMDIYNIWFE